MGQSNGKGKEEHGPLNKPIIASLLLKED